MSEPGMAKQPETGRVDEPKNQTPKIEKKAPNTRPAKKLNNDSKDSAESSAKAVQTLQKQISHVYDTAKDEEKQLKVLDKIQSEVNRLEERITQIERTSQETLSIVQRIKIKKKKGKNKGKGKKSKN